MLFNDAWSQKGHSASNTDTRIKLLMSIILLNEHAHLEISAANTESMSCNDE